MKASVLNALWRTRPLHSRRPWTVRSRLLLTVNAAMAVLVAAFLVLDYRRELSDRLEQKQVALEEEAKTILPAVLHLRQEGADAVQQYLDSVCGQMHDAQSPGHHIAVRLGAGAVQATAHGRASPELLWAMQRGSRSPMHRAKLGSRELVVGSAEAAGVAAYVSEELGPLRRSVLGQILWRLAGMLSLGVVAAVLVSALLLRTVVKPLNRLVATVDQIAAGDFAVRARAFKSAELATLSEAINTMAATLEGADRHRRQEMARARRIQEHLLPGEIDVPGLSLTAIYRPASDVAGDYYDVIELPDETWLLCIADVSGHGVPAAMSAAMLKAFLQHAIEHHVAPERLLAFINRRFAAASPPGLFASMLLARWHPTIGSLTYASAGHEPAWLLSEEGEPRPLEATGLFLGIDAESTWTTRTLPLGPGDRLLLLTDGAAETFNPRQELFGRDRLTRLLVQHRDEPLEGLLGALDDALATHRHGALPMDDTTLVAAEFVGQELKASFATSPTRLSHCHSE